MFFNSAEDDVENTACRPLDEVYGGLDVKPCFYTLFDETLSNAVALFCTIVTEV